MRSVLAPRRVLPCLVALGLSVACLAGGAGGAGMQLGPNPLGQRFRHAGSTFLGGAAGPGVAPCFTDGPAGLPIEVYPGELSAIAGGARKLQISSPVREGGIVDVTVTGVPGEQVFFLLSGTHDPRYIGQQEASVLVGQPLPFVHARPLPASGSMSFSTTVPDAGI
jgi:hypothetical protein